MTDSTPELAQPTPPASDSLKESREPLPVPVAGQLRAVRNTLLWSIREDGVKLWQARWLAATNVPRLKRLLDHVDSDLGELIRQACAGLEPLDLLPWYERLEPLQAVIGVLGDGLDRADPTPPTLRARALLVSGAAGPQGEEPDESPTERRRGRRDRKRNKVPPKTTPSVVSPPRRRPVPRSLPPAEFGDPADTGRQLSDLAGADPITVAGLQELGIETIAQLLHTLPTRAVSLPISAPEGDLPADGSSVAMCGVVKVRWLSFSPQGRIAHLHLGWGDRTIRCHWPGDWPHGAAYCLPEDELVLAGTFRHDADGFTLVDALPWKADAKQAVWRPAYGLKGLEDPAIWALLHDILGTSLPRLIDPVPRELLGTARLPGLADAYLDLHRPLGPRGRGRSRLIFDEFFSYRLAQSAEKVIRPKGISHPLAHDLLSQLCLQHGLQLNDEQECAFDDVRRDLARPVAMVRLLQGDVGSGKALVALMAAVMVAEGRSQVLFLAPDSLAAEHRYMFAEPLLRSIGLVPHLIDKNPSKAQMDALRRGEAHIVFASHALLLRPEGLPEFKKLGLVVAEERESFGKVTQDNLGNGKFNPDLLVVTSVPIPSSLVFTLFATSDLTVLPPNPNSRVQTEVVQPGQRHRAFEVIRETLAAGQQAYIVFPLSRGTDVVDRARGSSLANALAKEALDGARVALYHGAMSREERFRIYEDFRRRRIDVLLATTTIEDAPEVDNATAMVVENADRFNLVRLHRLRGHVSQGREVGKCVFVVSQEPDPAGQAIVDLVAAQEDGFAIAEQDRLERGDEELLGGRTAELPQFKLGDPVIHRNLFIRARSAAIQLLVKDPQLRQRAHRVLASQIPGLPEPSARTPGGGQGQTSGGGRKRRRRRRRSGRSR
jgi:ATP-dependent DNA helicase RecG